MNTLPTDAQERKNIPVYSGFVKYFPLAMIAVAELSKKGNDQHNPGKPLHWDRSKSGDETDALMRHLLEAGTIDTDGIRHSAKVAWRAMANLEKELEAERGRQVHSEEVSPASLVAATYENGHYIGLDNDGTCVDVCGDISGRLQRHHKTSGA